MTNFILGEHLNEAVQFGFVSGGFDLPKQTVGISLPGNRDQASQLLGRQVALATGFLETTNIVGRIQALFDPALALPIQASTWLARSG